MHKKNKIGKRVLAYIITFVLCITMLPAGIFASENSSILAPAIPGGVSLTPNLDVKASPGSTILHIPTPPETGEHHRYNPTPVAGTGLPPLGTQFAENEQVRVTGPETLIQLPPNVNGKYIHVYLLDENNKIIAASAVMISAEAVTSPDKIADIFKDIHKEILGKTVDNVLVTNRNLVNNAFGDYNQMHNDMKNALTTEYQLLGILLTAIETQAGEMFTDIGEEHYAYNAVKYLAQRGIVTGTAEGLFNPEADITMMELIEMIKRAVNDISEPVPHAAPAKRIDMARQIRDRLLNAYYKDIDVDGILGRFSDVGGLDGENRHALAYLVEKDILRGYSDGIFDPNGTLKRAEFAFVLYNVLNMRDRDGNPNDFVNKARDTVRDFNFMQNMQNSGVNEATNEGKANWVRNWINGIHFRRYDDLNGAIVRVKEIARVSVDYINDTKFKITFKRDGNDYTQSTEINIPNVWINLGEASVRGRIDDSSGNPVEGVKVQLFHTRPDSNFQGGPWYVGDAVNPEKSATTDENGDYIITGVPKDNSVFAICITKNGYEAQARYVAWWDFNDDISGWIFDAELGEQCDVCAEAGRVCVCQFLADELAKSEDWEIVPDDDSNDSFIKGDAGKTVESIKENLNGAEVYRENDKGGLVPVQDTDTICTGMIIKNSKTEITVVIKNDLTGRGNPNIEDAARFLEHLVGNNPLEKAFLEAAADYKDPSALKNLRQFLNNLK